MRRRRGRNSSLRVAAAHREALPAALVAKGTAVGLEPVARVKVRAEALAARVARDLGELHVLRRLACEGRDARD